MKHILFTLLAAGVIISCNNPGSVKNTGQDSLPKNSTTAEDTSDFFPVSIFIAGEMKMVDSLQLPLSKSITVNKKTTQFPVTDEEFRLLAKNFTQPDVNSPALKSLYTKTNIADQSIPSVALTLTAKDKTLPIQKVTVFVKPDPIDNDKVSGIYIEKAYMLGDTSVNQKLYWKTGRNMQLITEKMVQNKTLPLEQVKVTWGPED